MEDDNVEVDERPDGAEPDRSRDSTIKSYFGALKEAALNGLRDIPFNDAYDIRGHGHAEILVQSGLFSVWLKVKDDEAHDFLHAPNPNHDKSIIVRKDVAGTKWLLVYRDPDA